MKLNDPRAKFFLLGIGFLASGAFLDSILWPKYGPTVAFLAGFVLVAIFGWLMQRLGLNKSLNKDATETRAGMMTWPMGVAWLVGIISLCILAEVEDTALKQPSRPTAEFSQPMNVKGVVRYVTPGQARADEIAHWTLFGGALIFIGSGWLNRRNEKNKPWP
jgi:biotin transporter BioY